MLSMLAAETLCGWRGQDVARRGYPQPCWNGSLDEGKLWGLDPPKGYPFLPMQQTHIASPSLPTLQTPAQTQTLVGAGLKNYRRHNQDLPYLVKQGKALCEDGSSISGCKGDVGPEPQHAPSGAA